MKRILLWAVLFLLASNLCAAASETKTVTVTDMAGRQVTAPFDPDRIICIGPGTLRLIVYLQAASKVAGVEDMEKMNPGGRPYWIAHPELGKLPRCGPGGPASINKKPDLEAVLSVNPQVVFITYMDGELADEVQRTLGIPVVVLSYGKFATFDETVYDALGIAGKILHREKRADEVVSYIESLRSDLQKRTRDIPTASKPSVYIGGVGYRGSQGIESTEQHFAPFDWTCARNVAQQVKPSIGSHVFMDKEMLLKLNPDIIFIDGGGLNRLTGDYRKKPEYYKALKAFSRQKVFLLFPFNFYTTNIGTALADAYAVGKILYPERFADVDLEKKSDEIYAFLVGASVYPRMKKSYGVIGRKAPF
ncbi:MAG TPA: iron ABC transporter substrate-binding protein [bacterium]|nr:iron ABC transporter substrate-binding protein [bacterium]